MTASRSSVPPARTRIPLVWFPREILSDGSVRHPPRREESAVKPLGFPVLTAYCGQLVTLTLSGWVNIPMTSDDFNLEFQVRWRDAAGNVLSTVPMWSRSWDTYGRWTSFAAPVVAPANATQATIRQVVTSLNRTIYVDNLIFGQ